MGADDRIVIMVGTFKRQKGHRAAIDAVTDDEIYDFFASSYGEQVLLDPPLTGWGIALWSLPVMVLLAGGWVIWTRQRRVA